MEYTEALSKKMIFEIYAIHIRVLKLDMLIYNRISQTVVEK